MIDQKGLVIRHWVQRKTTRNGSKPWTLLPRMIIMISSLWSCRRASCRMCFLCSRPSKSQYFVFVGNNPQAKQVLEFMQRPADKIAFGFQGTAGRREHDHVVSVYASAGMTVGGATTPLSGTFRNPAQDRL